MRRTLIGLVAAGALLVAGCGGDDDDDTASNDGGGGDGSTEGFCEQFLSYDEQFTNNPDASDEEVIDAIRSLNPPPEIEDDFQTLVEGLDELAAVDATDEEAAAELEDEMAAYTEASANIQAFVDEECGGGSEDTSTDPSVTTEESTPETTG